MCPWILPPAEQDLLTRLLTGALDDRGLPPTVRADQPRPSRVTWTAVDVAGRSSAADGSEGWGSNPSEHAQHPRSSAHQCKPTRPRSTSQADHFRCFVHPLRHRIARRDSGGHRLDAAIEGIGTDPRWLPVTGEPARLPSSARPAASRPSAAGDVYRVTRRTQPVRRHSRRLAC